MPKMQKPLLEQGEEEEMTLDPIFRISQLTLPVATVLGSAWITVSKNLADGALFLCLGAIFTIILRWIEQAIFADNIYNGRYRDI